MNPIRVLLACPTTEASGQASSGSESPYALGGFSRGGRGIEVVGWVEPEEDVPARCSQVRPDVLLLDADTVGTDAFQLTKQIVLQIRVTAVIFVSSSDEPDDLRRAMLAGAEEYLIKPTDAEAVSTTIFDVVEMRAERGEARPDAEESATGTSAAPGKVIAVASGKGGLGKTTIAVNLAAALSQGTETTVALVGLEGGDSAILLNLTPSHSIAELSLAIDEVDDELLEGYGARHESGVTLFAALRDPLEGEPAVITVDCASRVIELLRGMRDFIVIDMPLFQTPQETEILTSVDDILCLTSTWDLLAVRNTKMFLSMLPQGCREKTRIVVNRAGHDDMIRDTHIQKTLGLGITSTIRNDAKIVPQSINLGTPFVVGEGGSAVAQDVIQLARLVSGAVVTAQTKKRKMFRLFG